MKAVLGHIDCPSCGAVKGMRITQDKNGAPFGFCEAECGQQLRIGGDKRRVRSFVARYPWAAGEPVTVTGDEAVAVQVVAPVPVPVAAPVATPVVPEPVKPVKRSPLQDAAAYLLSGGVSA